MLHRLALFALLFVALGLTACDEEIAPNAEIEAYYTLWGALDPLAETQAIRVIPIRQEIEGDTLTTIDATVTSTDLATGEMVTWRDSVITFPNGSVGHVFLGDVEVVFGGQYQIEVTRSDGKSSSVFTRIPLNIEPIAQDLQFVAGDARYPVLWPGAPQLNDIRVTYELEDGNCDRFDYVVPFEGNAEPFELGWLTTLSLVEDADRVITRLEGRRHAATRITLSADIAGVDWRPPGGVFDEEVLVEPGTFSNVQRGFGYVGGAYRASATWVPSGPALAISRFDFPGFGACAQGGAATE